MDWSGKIIHNWLIDGLIQESNLPRTTVDENRPIDWHFPKNSSHKNTRRLMNQRNFCTHSLWNQTPWLFSFVIPCCCFLVVVVVVCCLVFLLSQSVLPRLLVIVVVVWFFCHQFFRGGNSSSVWFFFNFLKLQNFRGTDLKLLIFRTYLIKITESTTDSVIF